MKRKFLEELGLDAELIDKIMKEHGKTMQETKGSLEEATTTAEQYKEQLATRDEDIAKYKEQIAALEKDKPEDNSGVLEELRKQLQANEEKYDKQKSDYETQFAAQKKQFAIETNLIQAGAKNVKATMALLENDTIELTDSGLKGLNEQLTKLKETDGYLFNAGPAGQAVAGGNPARSGEPPLNAFDAAAKKYTK